MALLSLFSICSVGSTDQKLPCFAWCRLRAFLVLGYQRPHMHRGRQRHGLSSGAAAPGPRVRAVPSDRDLRCVLSPSRAASLDACARSCRTPLPPAVTPLAAAGAGCLMTEGCRGEGGILRNQDGADAPRAGAAGGAGSR